jgi:hypothetical protein
MLPGLSFVYGGGSSAPTQDGGFNLPGLGNAAARHDRRSTTNTSNGGSSTNAAYRNRTTTSSTNTSTAPPTSSAYYQQQQQRNSGYPVYSHMNSDHRGTLPGLSIPSTHPPSSTLHFPPT